MPRRSAALLLALALTSTPAVAQNGVSQADQDACTPDVFKLCQEYIPDEAPIVACLQAKHAQLSAACEPVIFPHAGVVPGAGPARHHRRKHKSA